MSRVDARVVAAAGSVVWVEVAGRAPTCGNCKTAEACQAEASGLAAAPRRYRVENRIGAQVGDRVQLTVAEGTLWRAALWSYGAPLLLAIVGAALGQSVAGDAGAVGGTVAGLACGLAALRLGELRTRGQGNPISLQAEARELRFKERT